MGSRARIVDRLQQLRDELGFSYVTFYDSDAGDVAEVVGELAGR